MNEQSRYDHQSDAVYRPELGSAIERFDLGEAVERLAANAYGVCEYLDVHRLD